MKFSLILPTHNAAGRIHKALESVRNQTFANYELIVVCDACDDDTALIAKEYGAIVEEVGFHNPGPTRSRGLDVASGEWILFMDDDDWWLHEFAFEQINDNLGGEDLLCFGFIWRYRGYAAPLRSNRSLWPAPWNKAWRRSAIGDTRFPEEYPDDYLFHCKMMNKHPTYRFLDMPLYYYNYWRDGSVSVQNEPDLRGIKL